MKRKFTIIIFVLELKVVTWDNAMISFIDNLFFCVDIAIFVRVDARRMTVWVLKKYLLRLISKPIQQAKPFLIEDIL